MNYDKLVIDLDVIADELREQGHAADADAILKTVGIPKSHFFGAPEEETPPEWEHPEYPWLSDDAA